MPESPASPTPYEVLGVPVDASQADVRRAYRRLLRETHPDTGGDPARFHAVQDAWQRIGERSGRGSWDQAGPTNGQHATGGSEPREARARADSSLRARTYGHPGGYARERFLVLMREWAGRGADLADPYDPDLVRTAPREIRHLLADALAEEATVRAVSSLGIGYTIWSNVATNQGKLDHVILGPAGLFAVMSEDWGSPVRPVRGELIGDGIPAGEQPIRYLSSVSRALGKSSRVRFTARLIVVPDDSLTEPITRIGKKHGVAAVALSALPRVLRDGLADGPRLSIEDVFEVRSRLQHSIQFV